MVTTVTATVLVWKKHLELIVEAYADDVIGARVGLGAIGCLLVVVAVERAEVTDVEAHLLVDVPGSAEADAVTVAGERGVLLYAIAGANVMSIHGPMAFQIASSQEPATSITRNILFGTLPQYKIPANPYNRIGHAEGIIFGTFNSVRYDLQYGSVEQVLIAHLHNYEIPVCCGFPVGSNSCIPLIEGALCSLDVRGDSATLTYRIKGSVEPYEVDIRPDARGDRPQEEGLHQEGDAAGGLDPRTDPGALDRNCA